MIQAFVHDPLLEWQDAGRAQQNVCDFILFSNCTFQRSRQRGGPALAPCDLAADAVALVGKRLEGHIVTPEVILLNHFTRTILGFPLEIQHVSNVFGRPSEQAN